MEIGLQEGFLKDWVTGKLARDRRDKKRREELKEGEDKLRESLKKISKLKVETIYIPVHSKDGKAAMGHLSKAIRKARPILSSANKLDEEGIKELLEDLEKIDQELEKNIWDAGENAKRDADVKRFFLFEEDWEPAKASKALSYRNSYYSDMVKFMKEALDFAEDQKSFAKKMEKEGLVDDDRRVAFRGVRIGTLGSPKKKAKGDLSNVRHILGRLVHTPLSIYFEQESIMIQMNRNIHLSVVEKEKGMNPGSKQTKSSDPRTIYRNTSIVGSDWDVKFKAASKDYFFEEHVPERPTFVSESISETDLREGALTDFWRRRKDRKTKSLLKKEEDRTRNAVFQVKARNVPVWFPIMAEDLQEMLKWMAATLGKTEKKMKAVASKPLERFKFDDMGKFFGPIAKHLKKEIEEQIIYKGEQSLVGAKGALKVRKEWFMNLLKVVNALRNYMKVYPQFEKYMERVYTDRFVGEAFGKIIHASGGLNRYAEASRDLAAMALEVVQSQAHVYSLLNYNIIQALKENLGDDDPLKRLFPGKAKPIKSLSYAVYIKRRDNSSLEDEMGGYSLREDDPLEWHFDKFPSES